MLFGKKVKRDMEVMKERNKRYLEGQGMTPDDGEETVEQSTADREKEYRSLNDDTKLEKGDVAAMIISAILVFGPIFLVLGGILALAWYLLS